MDLSSLLSLEILQKALSVLADGSVILGALLAILGGLKVLARYTSSEADDKALEAAEGALRKVRDLVAKLLPFKK